MERTPSRTLPLPLASPRPPRVDRNISPLDIASPFSSEKEFWEAREREGEKRSITRFISDEVISLRGGLRGGDPRIRASQTHRNAKLGAPRLSSSDSFDAARSPNIRSKHPSVRRDEGRIYLHDARPLNPIHLSRWSRGGSTSRELERRARRRGGVWGGKRGRNFISARINFKRHAEDAVATRRGLKLRILWLEPVLRILCFSFFNLAPLVFHTISYEHTRLLSSPFSLYFLPRPLDPRAR